MWTPLAAEYPLLKEKTVVRRGSPWEVDATSCQKVRINIDGISLTVARWMNNIAEVQ